MTRPTNSESPPGVFVVVPAYNEGRVIATSLDPLLEKGYSVVVIDDCSTDDTWSILQTVPVAKLRHPINLGQGAALQTGMSYALKQGAEYIVHFDADGQHRVEDIDHLLEPLLKGDADVVLGSRFLRHEDRMAIPKSRRWLLRAGVIVNGFITGMWLTDAHNGFRAFTAAGAAAIDLRENRFAHASEILSQIRRARLRHVEVPTTIVYSDYSREKGQSSWNAIKIVMDIVMRRVMK
jgi:polyprenyl-phospho-N-acetylgalactosaminyl synthase